MDNFELYYRLNKNNRSKKITGVPPLSFVSNGENLSDCKIYGASGGVGDRTVNLFDGSYTQDGYLNPDGNIIWNNEWGITDYIPVDSDTVILSGYFKGLSPSIALYDSQKNLKNASKYDIDPNAPTQYHEKVITADGAAYCRFSVKFIEPQYIDTLQLQTGSTATAYEPYGYKIPVTCGGATTNIYLNEPLAEGESISSRSAGVSIPTINGTTILSVDTAVQPSHIYIKYGDGGSDNSSLLKYLEYKYKYAKE